MAGARPLIVVEGVGVAEDTQHQALYRRYRPQTPSDLLGQEHVVRALTGAVREGRLHHAYLFCGPRGTGKTSTARILAKLVNCEASSVIANPGGVKQSSSENISTKIATDSASPRNDETTIPCNKCATCLSITDGSNLDLVEI